MLKSGLVLLCAGLAALALAGQPEPGAVAHKNNPALEPVQDKPGLPRVLLIGDSISIGYTLFVREMLQESANVHRIPENGGPTSYAVERIDTWLGKSKWDVIHFNWGLHDIKHVQGAHQVSIADYEKNLRVLVAKMKATGAALIWCSTTPVPEGKLSPPRIPGDEVAFNAVAKKVMDENGIAINDLYEFAKPQLATIQQKENVHFFAKGSSILAAKVRDAILAALKTRPTSPVPAPAAGPVARAVTSPVTYRTAVIEAPRPERPNDKQRFPFGWKALELAPEGRSTLTLTFAGAAGGAEEGAAAVPEHLRITVAVDTREEKSVEVVVAGGDKLGEFDIRFASMLEPFELVLTPEQAALAQRRGVTLKLTKGKDPLWILVDSPEPSLNPHLMSARGADPRAEFLRRMNSLASIQQFGWMEGCVLDGLRDLEAIDPAFASATRRHLDLFTNEKGELYYEDHVSNPRKNSFATIEGTLPVAVLAKVFPDHPAIQVAEKFWRPRAKRADGLIMDGATATTEGAYTVAYPIAVLAKQRNDAELRTMALNQLRGRQKILAVDGGVHQRGNADSGKAGMKNWSRGVAWYMLGFARTLIELKDHAAETEDLRSEFKRCAAWVVTHQQPDGLWRCFIDDAKTGPETSGTAGIAAALALGVRHGLLPEEHMDAARKADAGLQKYLTPDGFLTGVAQSNKGGEALQRGTYRVIFQMGMGLYAQLIAALDPRNGK